VVQHLQTTELGEGFRPCDCISVGSTNAGCTFISFMQLGSYLFRSLYKFGLQFLSFNGRLAYA